MKFTIYNFTFSILPPSQPSPPVAAPRLVERDRDTEDLGLKTRG
ncbi:hypothetical protein RISK_006349 [Rhodopirellula islandica]|uniref:Uncharacterized protein n=1 Tax=Rhodopirellula islandica TaxID=595434 RepID=A0A0J1B4T4_RHOIS|nr:hypothetical protein RISK_006349 [Rhodopirellula islandica]